MCPSARQSTGRHLRETPGEWGSHHKFTSQVCCLQMPVSFMDEIKDILLMLLCQNFMNYIGSQGPRGPGSARTGTGCPCDRPSHFPRLHTMSLTAGIFEATCQRLVSGHHLTGVFLPCAT